MKNQSFQGKRWFWTGQSNLPRKKPNKTTTIFVENHTAKVQQDCFVIFRRANLVLVFHTKTIFSSEKQKKHFGLWLYGFPKNVFCLLLWVFPRTNVVFRSKTIFFLGKDGFSTQKQPVPSKQCAFCCLHVLRVSVASKVPVSYIYIHIIYIYIYIYIYCHY